MAKIALTQGLNTDVDDEVAGILDNYKWFTVRLGAANTPYAATKLRGKRILMHRYLESLPFGDPRIVDHRDGDPLNNRRSNLRVCDHIVNQRNRKRNKNNTTGRTGVFFIKDHGTAGSWGAHGMVDGKLKTRSFACKKYGHETARRLALSWRKRHEANQNITVRN